jgi:hypothetical protein
VRPTLSLEQRIPEGVALELIDAGLLRLPVRARDAKPAGIARGRGQYLDREGIQGTTRVVGRIAQPLAQLGRHPQENHRGSWIASHIRNLTPP